MEMTLIRGMFSTGAYTWIGLRDYRLTSESTWQWQDGSSYDFEAWQKNQR